MKLVRWNLVDVSLAAENEEAAVADDLGAAVDSVVDAVEIAAETTKNPSL